MVPERLLSAGFKPGLGGVYVKCVSAFPQKLGAVKKKSAPRNLWTSPVGTPGFEPGTSGAQGNTHELHNLRNFL
jgi:hypothetical protein